MLKAAVLRSLVLFGFLCLTQCAERAIRIKVNGEPVYRDTAYVKDKETKIECLPPKEEKPEVYDNLAIYREKTVVCQANAKPSCGDLVKDPPSLTLLVKENGNYSCEYVKQPEPAVTPAKVALYLIGKVDVKVEDDSGKEMTTDFEVRNHTNYEFACPGGKDGDGSKVVWYRNTHPIKFEHNPSYDLNATTNNLVLKTSTAKVIDGSRFGGNYLCERFDKNNGFMNRAVVTLNSRAYAAAAQKSYNRMEGESVTMSCDIEGEPVPTVLWKRKDKDTLKDLPNTGEAALRYSYGWYKGIPGASMTIKDLVAEDYGDYVCVAKGVKSYSEFPILLRVRSKLAALWPFLGIVAEVIVLVAVIFIYEKRRAKKEQEETDDTADQKKSLTASNNENKDVRQRKA